MHIVGISQGGIISRSIVEQCDGLNVKTLFTWGGPLQGVSAYQKCKSWWCPFANRIVGWGAEFALIENFVAPSDYYFTWWNTPRYMKNNIFLPQLNNEKEPHFEG
jgi:palmitoyl-protein thioesterase